MKRTSDNKGRHLLGSLFLTFAKIGAFTFGGGWAMISIMQREIVDRHGWLDEEEFLDQLAVAQSMPGILAVARGPGVFVGGKGERDGRGPLLLCIYGAVCGWQPLHWLDHLPGPAGSGPQRRAGGQVHPLPATCLFGMG